MEPQQIPDAHAQPGSSVLAALRAPATGLTAAEAAQRLARFGPNQMKVSAPVGVGALLVAQLRSMVVWLLALAGVVALVLGDLADAIAIGAVLLINTLVGFFTELRARSALAALLRMDVTHGTVVRDGRVQDIDARGLVPGDVIHLEAGQLVPADARVLSATDLQVDEAPLTGESIPVPKQPGALSIDTALADRSNMLYKATTAVTGRAIAVVVSTGMHTEVGRIGGLVSSVQDEKTPLEQKLEQLGRRLALVALAAAALVTVVGLLRGMQLGEVLETAIALAVAAVPEGLPAVATVTLALGVHRMARRNALVRRLPSVETLGSVTLICTDKTGTLTAGVVTATVLWLDGHEYDVEKPTRTPMIEQAARVGVLANRAHLHADGGARGDPTELALLQLGSKLGLERAALEREFPEIGEVPFSSERRWMATMHRQDGATHAYVKGATAVLLERCTQAWTPNGATALDAVRRARIEQAEAEMAGRGLRVLALAAGVVQGTAEVDVHGLELIGLVGMMDPPAEGVRDTIDRFQNAGIRTVMITGDQQRTAAAVAGRLGLMRPGDRVIDGQELDRLDDAELLQQLPHTPVFSRITPDAKLRLIRAYQQRGDIVAMIGDGINDAAALRKADVGVAMGGRGTDVAKEAAAVVLQDDRFQTIAVAIEQGRVVFDNIRKFVFYLFSCNLAEVLLLLIAGAIGWPLPLLPLQILWLNLVTDTFPALALAVEPGEAGVMAKPPRNPREAILSASFIRAVSWYAVLITIATLAVIVVARTREGTSIEYVRTMAFVTLGLAQAFHLGTARSTGHVLGIQAFTNKLAIAAVLLVIALQALTLYYGPLARLLDTVPLSWSDWLLVLAFAATPGIVGQVARFRGR
ncbi:MAG: HAD-IC family P-type ATPase [Gemmatimonadota bacterium]